ncbi:peptidylprolyl isomerase [Qipengyuania zhejiangensis]|uniref:peptidylprolyl isomerase n=1 Tax=Qipengyuania zhejiangensis TaxID=3077782 RepID=UPI002D79CA8C|nr:peptidylprolyl isomerase [Qipengyuania sp. Z2]
MIRRWLHEPLVHFLIAGVAIYAALGWLGNPVDPADRTIALTKEGQAGIALGFERTLGRAPTDAEMDGLVDRWVREEVLYREALRLGLDSDDPVVRRRLSTKMEELATASAETDAVSDATLQDWLDAHRDRFADGGTASLSQLWYASEAAARTALAKGSPRGFPISLPPSVSQMPLREIREIFGQQFAVELAGLQPQPQWQGPIPSGFGWHLVRLTARTPGSVPALESVRAEVEADWRNATIAERREQAYQVLRDAYTVKRE